MAKQNLLGLSADVATPAVKGEFTGTGPTYVHDGGKGIQGHSQNGYGVYGFSEVGRGVVASSDTNYGLRATSRTLAAARCSSVEGTGVEGEARNAGDGVRGSSKNGNGIVGSSETGRGVVGISHNHANAGISGHNPDGLAGFFEGDVQVTGDIKLLNADFAEDFDVTSHTEPGEVMVLTSTDTLEQSTKAYDKKVVGVISGAGRYKPAIILDRQSSNNTRRSVAMMGKVYCKVEADTSPIETGDMLTTSDISGYAMKAVDPFKSFGAVIGKALAPLNEGKGLIPILVTLQ